jgi:hypothetical protein
MPRAKNDRTADRKAQIRCAIYTRKSSEEGLEQDFNSLDAQREAGRAYVQSQRHEGWRLLTIQYDDGGYSGGTLDRPALQRLLACWLSMSAISTAGGHTGRLVNARPVRRRELSKAKSVATSLRSRFWVDSITSTISLHDHPDRHFAPYTGTGSRSQRWNPHTGRSAGVSFLAAGRFSKYQRKVTGTCCVRTARGSGSAGIFILYVG